MSDFRHVPLTRFGSALNPALSAAEREAAQMTAKLERAILRGDKRKQGEINAQLIQKRAECLRLSLSGGAA